MRASPSALLSACLLGLCLAACAHVPTQKEMENAQIHYDLGIQAQQAGDVQSAFKEFQSALEAIPDFPEAHNAIGILLHLAFRRPDEAIDHYQQALKVKPLFSDSSFPSQVKTNLANVYLDQARYDEAITLYQAALNDMLYPTPYIAQGNLGWALYKRGDAKRDDLKKALDAIKSAVTTNPKFCQGYRNLGIIYDEQGQTQDACRSFSRYRETCPEVADAYYREGICLAKLGDNAGAKRAFATCQTQKPSETLREDCRRLLEHLQ